MDSPGFDFYGGDYSGNIPNRGKAPFLPEAHKLLEALWKMKDNGEYEARQLDWGAWGAKMTKQELSDFVEAFYGKDKEPEVREYIQGLEQDKAYVLVAFESG